MASRKIGRLLLVTGTLSICSYLLLARNTHTLPRIALTNPITRSIGDKVDSFNNVYVYYNGSIGHVLERHISKDGYNLGLKYQCVEFVKRYYYQYYKHKMPDSYGHAKDFFNKNLSDGAFNKGRNLRQFSNPSSTKPKIGDILVFDGHEFNPYGHVAIVTAVSNETIEIIQQNPGPTAPSRETLPLYHSGNQFEIEDGLGWLGKR
jgi:surface antigen